MIEVFKTNVKGQKQANFLRDLLHKTFDDAIVSFDLEDCDRILRFESPSKVAIEDIVWVVMAGGFTAENLPD